MDTEIPIRKSSLAIANPLGNQKGSVLVVALLIMLALSLLGVAGIMTTTTEFQIAGNQYRGLQAMYAADGGGEYMRKYLGGATPTILMIKGADAVPWTDIPGSNPFLAKRDRFRVAAGTADKAPSVGPTDFLGVVKGSTDSKEISDVMFARAKFNVGEIEGQIQDLNVSRRVELAMSFLFKEGEY